MTWERAEAVTRASQLATVFSSLKSLGLTDRGLLNEILRRVLEANPRLLGVWTVWEPDALDGLDTIFAGAPGHDQSGRFVPFCIAMEALFSWRPISTMTSRTPICGPGHGERQRSEDRPRSDRVAGKNLFISSTAAPIFHAGRCVGVVGFDVHMDWLLEAIDEPGPFEFYRGGAGSRACSARRRQASALLESRDATIDLSLCGRQVGPECLLPEPLNDLVTQELRRRFFSNSPKLRREWTFGNGSRKLVVRFTRHPQTGCVLLLVDEQVEDDWAEVDLSPREHEVVDWVGQGKSNDEIAILLGISAHTVKNHLDKIYRKLGVENRCAAAMALQRHRFAIMERS